MQKKAFFLCLAVLSVYTQCYILKQGWGQIGILYNRRPITEILEDPNTDRSVRAKLLFVEEVRRFAKNHMGLKVNKTYTYYTQLERKALAWNVVASEKLSLGAKYWEFPIVGKVPYLGFFDLADAKEKAKELAQEGWDSKVSVVSAYSTLGWFDDPLISTQLNYPNWYLAALLMHECAHATLWFKGDVPFNESFASFVGRQGAITFYKKRKAKAKGYQKMLFDLARNRQKRNIYRYYTRRLQRLYASKLKDEVKLQRKKALFRRLEKRLVQKGFRDHRLGKTQAMNNVDLISFTHYHSGSKYFLYEFRKCKKKWDCFLKKMEKLKTLPRKERYRIWRRA